MSAAICGQYNRFFNWPAFDFTRRAPQSYSGGEVEHPWAKHFQHDDLEILLVICRHPVEQSDFGLNEWGCAAVLLKENLFTEVID